MPQLSSANNLFLDGYYSKYFNYAKAIISLRYTKTVMLHRNTPWTELHAVRRVCAKY
jgi:hypothetical protein